MLKLWQQDTLNCLKHSTNTTFLRQSPGSLVYLLDKFHINWGFWGNKKKTKCLDLQTHHLKEGFNKRNTWCFQKLSRFATFKSTWRSYCSLKKSFFDKILTSERGIFKIVWTIKIKRKKENKNVNRYHCLQSRMMFQIFEIPKKYSLQNKKVVGISEDKITSMNVFPYPILHKHTYFEMK